MNVTEKNKLNYKCRCGERTIKSCSRRMYNNRDGGATYFMAYTPRSR